MLICVACKKDDRRKSYLRNRVRENVRSKEWLKSHPGWSVEHSRQYYLNNADSERARSSKRKRDNPEKTAAQQAACWAVKTGKILPRPCFVCGNAKAEKHHAWGYAPEDRLRVIFVCKSHHYKADNDPTFNAELIEMWKYDEASQARLERPPTSRSP